LSIVKRRPFLALLLAAPVGAADVPLADFLPLLRQQLLDTGNRNYRRQHLDSRVVLVGEPKIIPENQIQVRLLERWLERGELEMLLVDYTLSFAKTSRWYLTGASLAVQALPDPKLGPTSRQYLNPATPISVPTIQVTPTDASEGALAQAVRELLDRWQQNS
jgi:hypothetical protein